MKRRNRRLNPIYWIFQYLGGMVAIGSLFWIPYLVEKIVNCKEDFIMEKTRKIRCYINGEYCFTTTKFSSQKALKNHLRSVKHIEIASIPVRYVTIYDYDKLTFEYV